MATASSSGALSLPTTSSSPTANHGKKTMLDSSLFVPIELENGCTEEGCQVDSDDPILTNTIRKHYLEHFGHRDLEAIVSDYAPTAYMVTVVNGERAKYHGQDEIRSCFERVIFHQHPTTDSTFHLKHITVQAKHAMAVWTAVTPNAVFPQSTDTFVFDSHGKIIKQFFTCQINEKDVPWYEKE